VIAGIARPGIAVALAATLTAGCGAAGPAGTAGHASPRSAGGHRARPVGAPHRRQSMTVRFGRGRRAVVFGLREPAGIILGYTISVPRGVVARAWSQVPGLTVPLEIRTSPNGPVASCRRSGPRIVCTQGEEGCPMPAATWRVRIVKLAGPAGRVTLRLRVGRPQVGSRHARTHHPSRRA
jgi:hypothetical protein